MHEVPNSLKKKDHYYIFRSMILKVKACKVCACNVACKDLHSKEFSKGRNHNFLVSFQIFYHNHFQTLSYKN